MGRLEQFAAHRRARRCLTRHVIWLLQRATERGFAMHVASADQALRIFSTCPPSALGHADSYRRQVEEIARWSEDAGCEGSLVYTDNGQVDAWLASQLIIGATRRLCPLVAIQPAYMHPAS